MKKIFATFTLLLALIPFNYSYGRFVFVSMITRHGDRAPFTNIQNANYKWGTELSELTPIGMNQEYNLGVQLRKRYINLIFYQSIAYTQLGTGRLLSEGNPAIKGRFQPIPIMTLSADSRLIQFPYEQYLAVLKKYVYNSPAWQNKIKEVHPNFAKRQQITR